MLRWRLTFGLALSLLAALSLETAMCDARGRWRAAAHGVRLFVHDPDSGAVNAFVLNRSREATQLEIELRGLGERSASFARDLCHADIKAINTNDEPNESRRVTSAILKSKARCSRQRSRRCHGR